MPAGGERSAHAAGMLGSVRRVAVSFVALLQTRLELIATEAEERLLHLTRLWLLAAIALALLALGLVAATLFVVVLFWDTHRLAALGVIALAYLIGGAGVAVYAGRLAKSGPRLFETSLAELARDGNALKTPLK